MALKIVALVLPLRLDTLAVSTALTLGGLSAARRLHTSLVFTAFEAAMPLVGLAIGRPLGNTIGAGADYVAIGVLAGLGLYVVLADDGDDRVAALADRRGFAMVASGLSISLDELAVGFRRSGCCDSRSCPWSC